MISLEILTPLQKFPKNVRDLGKLIVVKSFKKLPKVKKLPNLVTLQVAANRIKHSTIVIYNSRVVLTRKLIILRL